MTIYHSIADNGNHIFFNGNSGRYLILSKGDIEVTDDLPSVYGKSGAVDTATSISCIVGVIKLKINSYVIIADKSREVGNIIGRRIAKIESFRLLPLGNTNISKKNSEENQYVELVRQHLQNASLFYSVDNEYDLTNSLQRQFILSPLVYDHKFWWNSYLCEGLIEAKANDFVTPIIYGYVNTFEGLLEGKHPVLFSVLTRRSTRRAGTRYFRRGIDEEGSVANFNETEQIFLDKTHQHVYSLLQIRGSVPVYWCEINNLRYKPNLVISRKSSLDAAVKHFSRDSESYGDIYCVNLVNKLGHEKPVKDAFEGVVESLPDPLHSHIKYIYFDFHHECRNMRWDRVKILLEHLQQMDYTSDNYFHADLASRHILSKQSKVVRSNCMDCLDRTNVVQSMIGRWCLQHQLQKANLLSSAEITTPWEVLDPSFNRVFQNIWADNADAVSCGYSGTGALKTDFTRTGKRTRMGAVKDFLNSATRYYKNNCTDGLRQDSFDLLLGNYKPFQESITSPFLDLRPPFVQLLPYLMCTSLLVFIALICYPRGSIFDWKNLMILGGCICINVESLFYFKREGYQFVNWPKLKNLEYLKKVDSYNSEGKFVGIKYTEDNDFVASDKKIN